MIKGFVEFSFLDWPGRISGVVFVGGCNFRCPYCQNHPLVLRPGELPDVPLGEVLRRLEPGWIDGVVISGGEPLICPELPNLCRAFRRAGFRVKLETNGSRPAMLERLLAEGLVDAVSMDIKAPLEEEPYARAAGVRVDLEAIRRSLRMLQASAVEHDFRLTVVPGIHSERDVRAVAELLRGDGPLVLQDFSPHDPLDPRLRELRPYGRDWIERMQREVNRIVGCG